MTATASTKQPKRVSPALHNWRSNVMENKKMFIIFCILHLVAVPAVLIALIVSVYSGSGANLNEGYMTIAVSTTALAGFMGIFTAVESFRCLHDKSVVDMKLALPMTASQRFISNFLSGLFTYLAPFLAAQVISLLLVGYGCLFMDGRTFYEPQYNNLFNEMRPTPYTCDIFGQFMTILLRLIAGGLLSMLMLYTITVLITVCCGNKFEAIAHTILINIVIPATILCVTFSMLNSLYGIDAEVPAIRLLTFTSVAGGVYTTIAMSMENDVGTEMMSYIFGCKNGALLWAAVYFLITAAMGALAFFLYRKRRAEQVSKPFVFKLAYYIIVTGAMFCIVSLFNMSNAEIIPSLITTAIIYIIFEVVTNRGFKRFWLSIIKYAATVGAAYLVLFVGIKGEGFGAVQRVPLASSVKSIELGYSGFYGDFVDTFASVAPYYYSDYSYSMLSGMTNLLIKDKANIETVVEAHQTIIDDYNENKTFDSLSNYYDVDTSDYVFSYQLVVKYNLKNGSSFTRKYDMYSAKAGAVLGRLDLSEEFRQQMAEHYKNAILRAGKAAEKKLEDMQKPDYVDYGDELYANVYSDNGVVRRYQKEEYTSVSTRISIESLVQRDFYAQLAEAYYKDIMAVTEENYYRSEFKNTWNFADNVSWAFLNVPESFTNTVELLEYFDFGLERVENVPDYIIIREAKEAFINTVGVTLMTAGEWREFAGAGDVDPIYAGFTESMQGRNHRDSEYYVYDLGQAYCELARSAMPRNIVDNNGYIIVTPEFYGAIPSEMTETAAGINRSGRNEALDEQYAVSMDVWADDN